MTQKELVDQFCKFRGKCTTDDVVALNFAYEMLAPRWISVEEELPKIGKDVLVLREDGEMQVAHQYNEEIARWWSVDGFPLKNNITHWMPLPSVEHFRETTKMIEKGGEG